MKIEKQKTKTLIWEKITKPNDKDLKQALSKYNFNKLHIKECLPPLQRPRLSSDYDYLFMILNFPIYKSKTKEIVTMELDLFIGKNFVVTVQDQSFTPIDELFKELNGNSDKQKQSFKSPGYLVYEILNACLTKTFPLLNHLNIAIEDIEKKIFHQSNKEVIKEILLVMRNIVTFRKSITAHKSVIRKFISKSSIYFSLNGLSDYFSELINHTKEIWDSLDNYKDTIDALQQSYNSLHSWRLNEIIKTLTIFSVIIFTLTLIAAIFAIDPKGGMPFIHSNFGFWQVLGIEVFITLIILAIFKRKKWL